jgi:glycogen debranching enzyme
MWTMIGTYNYFLYTNDTGFIELNWSKYLKAMAFINAKVGANGILVANGEGDWGRWKYAKDGSAPNML